jgi:DNA-binding transcriptional ArsR family regulator
MGITKIEAYSEEILNKAQLFKALGHPARIAILEFLAKQTSCICGEIVAELPLSQASISRHLNELKEVGLIKGTISGTSVCYCLNLEKLPLLHQFIQQLNSPIYQTCCS